MIRDSLYVLLCWLIFAVAVVLLFSGCSVVEKNIYVETSGEVTVNYSTTSEVSITTDTEATIPALP